MKDMQINNERLRDRALRATEDEISFAARGVQRKMEVIVQGGLEYVLSQRLARAGAG